ncbi:MAG: hypothetical protein HZA28_00270 [Candidatus Omnitrophica bacterium]|nr:hypothetical protein [Candidatus Omnitrophota bacterium]
MSKAAKQGIVVLVFLLAGGLGFAGYTLLEKQKIEGQKISLERELQGSRDREKQNLGELKTLKEQLSQIKDQLGQAGGEKSKYEKTIADLQSHSEELLAQINSITGERDKWQSRLEDIKKERDGLLKERDELLAKLQDKPQVVYQEKIVYKEKEPAPPVPPVTEPVSPAQGADVPAAGLALDDQPPAVAGSETLPPEPPSSFGENQNIAAGARDKDVAELFKQKAALELEIEKLNKNLSDHSSQIVQLKQDNEALRMDLEAIRHEKELIEDEIKEKEGMIDNLSLALARTRNDKNFVAQKADKLTQQNMELRQQIKRLAAAKTALEKSIVNITRDKDTLARKLDQTGAVVQNKIDEIWEIKDSLDRSFKTMKSSPPSSEGEVELPPIVVSSQAQAAATSVGVEPPAGQAGSPESNPGFEGKVLSVNEESNFAIVDIGEKRGLRAGDTLGVYRGPDYIARLEVIQVRPDIAAADLKEQWSKIRAGDTVR